MRRMPYYQQEKEYYCGPAVLAMAFAAFGKKYSPQQLAREAKPNAIDGTSHEKMVHIVRAHSLHARTQTRASWGMLKQLSAQDAVAIINYVEPVDEEGHYAIVAQVTPSRITLRDPLYGENFTLPKKEFMRRCITSAIPRTAGSLQFRKNIRKVHTVPRWWNWYTRGT